jgi:choice-of-anchor A domain-containing protein
MDLDWLGPLSLELDSGIMKITSIFQLTVLSAGLSSTAFASGTAFTLTPYNALVFGAFSDTADFGGGIAAKGSLTISNTSVANSLLGEAFADFPGGYTLVAGGNLSATSGTLAVGDAYGGGSSNNFSLTMAGGYSYTHAPAADPLDFSTLQSNADNTSATLKAKTATGSCVFDGSATTTCTANAAGMNYITVTDPTILGSNRTVNIVLGSSNSFVVINVAGTTDTITNFGMTINGSGVNGDATTSLAHNVLFNYYQATSVSINSVLGSLLAPYASVSSASGQIDGNLIATSFNGPTELHNFGFEGTIPTSAPEPMSLIMIGCGMLGLGLIGKRRNKSARQSETKD